MRRLGTRPLLCEAFGVFLHVTPPGSEPGTYRFKANFSMAGRWQLSLGAKVQGETGTLENKLVIQADK